MMGMLATVMNALALEAAIERGRRRRARRMSALAMPEVCETYERRRALRHLDEGRMVAARGRHRQSVLHHRHHRGAAGRRDRRRGRAEGDRCGRRLQRRSEEGPKGRQALRPPDPSGGDRTRPEGHGRHRLRACPREPYAYHRVLDPTSRGRSRRFCAARDAPRSSAPEPSAGRPRSDRSGQAKRHVGSDRVLSEGRHGNRDT